MAKLLMIDFTDILPELTVGLVDLEGSMHQVPVGKCSFRQLSQIETGVRDRLLDRTRFEPRDFFAQAAFPGPRQTLGELDPDAWIHFGFTKGPEIGRASCRER